MVSRVCLGRPLTPPHPLLVLSHEVAISGTKRRLFWSMCVNIDGDSSSPPCTFKVMSTWPFPPNLSQLHFISLHRQTPPRVLFSLAPPLYFSLLLGHAPLLCCGKSEKAVGISPRTYPVPSSPQCYAMPCRAMRSLVSTPEQRNKCSLHLANNPVRRHRLNIYIIFFWHSSHLLPLPSSIHLIQAAHVYNVWKGSLVRMTQQISVWHSSPFPQLSVGVGEVGVCLWVRLCVCGEGHLEYAWINSLMKSDLREYRL